MRSRGRDERGVVALLVAAFATCMFILAALVVDLGHARDVRRQAQNAADAAALAGANVLFPRSTCTSPVGGSSPCFTDAVAAVKRYASSNFSVAESTWASCVDPARPVGYFVPIGGTPCISFDTSTSAVTKVRVQLPAREVTFGLGVLTGTSRVDVSAAARATLKVGAPQSCAICFLGSVDAGNADFTVSGTGASVRINGSVSAGPNSMWTASSGGSIGVVGAVTGGQFTPSVTTTSSFTDPYATTLSLPLSSSGLSTKNDPCSEGQGIYGAFEIPNKDTCTLSPGLYVITGTWSMKNGSRLAGTGVTLYVRSGGMLDLKNGDSAFSAATAPPASPSRALANIAVVYDRTNSADVILQGNGDSRINGAIYAPASRLDFNGNSCFTIGRGPVIAAGVVKANGNKACVNVTESVSASIATPPSEPNLDQ